MSDSPVTKITRAIPKETEILLFTRAGGRCEFDGCNKYLLEHHLTYSEGNFAQKAHIVAFSLKGPRGNDPHRPADINDSENLMLLCHSCHKEIDDNPENYPRQTLEKYKKNHEERIHYVTGLGPEARTTVIQLKARIGGESVHIDFADIVKAVAPRYPAEKPGHVIDLTAFNQESETFFQCAINEINSEMDKVYANGKSLQHISIFPFAPIPLLVYLGTQLSNKISTDIFQRHRDTENWCWKENEPPVDYDFKTLRKGTNANNVAFLLSLSGSLNISCLPEIVPADCSIYEMTLKGISPTPTFLRVKQDIENFKIAYQKAIRAIHSDHPQVSLLHLFPAVPIPIAVLLGRELMPKIDPEIHIYDNDKREGGFKFRLRCKKNERE